MNQSQVEQVASSTSYNAIDLTDYYEYAPIVVAHETANNLYVFNRSKMYNLQMFPLKVDKITEYDGSLYDSASAYNERLYMTVAGPTYEIATDSNLITFVNGDDLIYQDGTTISKRSSLTLTRRATSFSTTTTASSSAESNL
ncbi:hypothetical protein [Paenibacillus sp. USHLN196]|uniref:hypothetical protein n=1 Tax=Paenibacillus sp. USHLN196 TaxID=3081291 RepID=UPI003016C916